MRGGSRDGLGYRRQNYLNWCEEAQKTARKPVMAIGSRMGQLTQYSLLPVCAQILSRCWCIIIILQG